MPVRGRGNKICLDIFSDYKSEDLQPFLNTVSLYDYWCISNESYTKPLPYHWTALTEYTLQCTLESTVSIFNYRAWRWLQTYNHGQ